jgi:hypothetical protein
MVDILGIDRLGILGVWKGVRGVRQGEVVVSENDEELRLGVG